MGKSAAADFSEGVDRRGVWAYALASNNCIIFQGTASAGYLACARFCLNARGDAEAIAPEGFAAPQGTPETGLGLPVSLSVQFADGAAGEVAVAWQCAAGYDPNAEAGTQFAFAAVLPEGYALAEGVSLPQILVTLTPPLASAMLMAETGGTGWTLSDDGTLTVTAKGTFKSEVNNNGGAISESTFTAIVRNIDGGTISDGIFASTVYNIDEGAITDGTFAEIVLAGTSARVQGVDGSVPTLNGPIDNGGSILQPCNFGGNASVVENRGVIEVPATINGLAQSLRYGEKTLEQLKKINPNDVWFEQAADGTQARVAESATVGLESRAYVSKDLPRVSAPAAKIDFDGEAVAVSLDATFALPQGLQRGELDVVFTYGDKSGRIEGAFANGNSATVSLSDLGEALSLALPAANGSGDASLRVTLTAAGQEDSYN